MNSLSNFTLASRYSIVTVAGFLCLGVLGWTGTANAYDRYSQNRDATNCRACHGDFRDNNYISNTDGMDWGDLHDLHRNTMLAGDCDTCHRSGRFPVILNQSLGGVGLPAIACVGCHGRAEDDVPGNPEVADGGSGYGAGLRQHHFNAGVVVCSDCHLDADPANYAAVGESVSPPYYGIGGNDHPNMPTDACNPDGNEDFAGSPEGLDNDGNDAYDQNDSDCGSTGVGEPLSANLSGLANSPNPFYGMTSIEFTLPEAVSAELRILDANGRLVRHLGTVDGGAGRVAWDGRNDRGRALPSGAYWAELTWQGRREPHLMTLIR